MRRLFWDMEVSPNIVLSWRTGYKLNIGTDNIIKERAIISIAWSWEEEADESEGKVFALHWDKDQNDKKMLAEFVEVLHSSDEAIAYFGDSFDLPWLRTRCLIHGIPVNPLLKTVDPLQWVRRKFYFNSNKLDYVAQTLGVGKKIETDYDLWKKVVIDKDGDALNYMVGYNMQDVVILKKVWKKINLWVKPKTHVGVMNGSKAWTCPRCGSDKVKLSKTRITATGTKQYQMQCLEDGSYYSISPTAHAAYEEA